MLWLDPSWVLQLGYLDLLQKTYPELCYILSQPLLKGVEFLTEDIKCHYNTVVFVQHLQNITQGGIFPQAPS